MASSCPRSMMRRPSEVICPAISPHCLGYSDQDQRDRRRILPVPAIWGEVRLHGSNCTTSLFARLAMDGMDLSRYQGSLWRHSSLACSQWTAARVVVTRWSGNPKHSKAELHMKR